MSNVNAPYGLAPSRKLGGGGAIESNPYSIASGYATAIYTGDVVQMTGLGRNIEQAPAGANNAIGVFVGCKFIDAEGEVQFKPYWPAGQTLYPNTECEALVIDDPGVVFRCQADAVAAADIGALCDWVVGAGSAVTGKSASYAEGSATATTGKSLRIMRLLPEVGNAYGEYAEIEVMFAEHALKGVVSGVGGD